MKLITDWEAAQPKICDEVDFGKATRPLTKHIPTGFGMKVVSPYEEFNSGTIVYRGHDCVERFFNCLEKLYAKCSPQLNHVKPMIITMKEVEKFELSTHCGICTKPFLQDDELGDKVPDHDHISGVYRCAAHSHCNLQMQQQKHIVIFMHNAKG